MIVLAVAALLAAVILGTLYIRERARGDDLQRGLSVTIAERDDALARVPVLEHAEQAAADERDEALEQIERTQRDAAEVATQLRDVTAERDDSLAAAVASDDQIADLRWTVSELQAVIDERSAALVRARDTVEDLLGDGEPDDGEPGTSGNGDHVDVDAGMLWALALVRVERIWRNSISLGLDDGSPLDDADDQLRAAVEIGVDAAREDAGADIELSWSGDRVVDGAPALVVLAAIESVIDAMAKTTSTTVIDVVVGPDDVRITFAATDDSGTALDVAVPDGLQSSPGVVSVPAPG